MRIGGGAVSIADVTDRTARDLGFVRPFWLNEIRAGRAFSGETSLAASVGNNSHLQLFNPVGSGITIVVKRIVTTPLADQSVEVRQHNTALTTLGMNGINLLSGGAAAIGEVRSQQNASRLGTRFRQLSLLANVPFDFAKDWDIELGAGEGVQLIGASTNVGIIGFYEWSEL